ncbi:RE1, partial [Symbiodinium sp. CCMP2592]
ADEMAAINVGDWLHGLSGPMGDLTDGSAVWWSQVLASLEAYYRDYVSASAVKKLQLKADDYAGAMLREAKWLRVDKRAASMLLQAVPENIRVEILANRHQTTLAMLARILTIYRPGSSVERQQVLKALESPGAANTPMELVEGLRRWARWLKRAQDLGLQVPDPSILLRGLDQAAGSQLAKNGEASFRANMLRYSLELDSDNNETYYIHESYAEGYGSKWGREQWSGLSQGAYIANHFDGGGEAMQVLCFRGWVSAGFMQVRNHWSSFVYGTSVNGSLDGPSMKMLKKAIKDYEGKMALVDSGATHPLRAASTEEWGCAAEVDVVVAGDGVKRMRQNDTGTLLLEPAATRAQTILPVGSLVAVLGYELIWTKKKCVLKGPDGEELALKVTSGCPEVSEATALELIAKIEQEKLATLARNTEETKQAMVRAREVQMEPCWEKSMKEYLSNGCFEDGFRALASAPWATTEIREDLARILTDLPKDDKDAWQLMQDLGFNRRMRKRLMSKDWAVKLCSGRRTSVDKVFKAVESNGTVVLDVDVQRMPLLDLLKVGPGVMRLLLWGAATGRVASILCGLPRHNALEHTLRAVVLNEVAVAGREAMCADVDVPCDGVAFSLWSSSEAEQDESSLAWAFKWFRRWIAERPIDLHHFEQGGLGHPYRRPTTMATNLDVAELKDVRDSRCEEDDKGSWAAWAPMMVRVLVQGLKRWKRRPGWYPRLVKALKAVDRRAWEKHIANDHVPYRADCLQCIHNATGRPHRKCLHRDCYVMSADTLGPVRVQGVKGERYAVVFTYQFPKQRMVPEDQPIPEGDLGGWGLDVEEGGKGTEPETLDDCDYSFDEGPDVELSPGELEELRKVQMEKPGVFLTEPRDDELLAARAAKKKEVSDDWWEFRESTGVLIRHHLTPRKALFRPTSWNGCPVPPAKLDFTRVTEVKYVGGGVDTETSDWHGPQSGSRALERSWTGRTTFRISAAEVPEDEAVLDKDEVDWEKLIGDLTKPVEMDTIYMVYPVRARRGGDVMLAVQEAVLRLKLMGLPVARLHSDRGSEFASKGLRKWLLDHDIYHTRSEALVLMAEAKVGLKYWTLAMQHAANRRIYERLGVTKPKLLPFGSKVMIRRKVFGKNKKYDLTDRWEEGTYLGLSDTIKGGAIVLRASGVLTETLNLKFDVIDPHALLAEREEDTGTGVGSIPAAEVPVVDLPEPDHRLKEKQPPPRLRALRLGGDGAPSGWTMRSLIQQQEERARYYYNMGQFDGETCAKVLQDVHVGRKSRRRTRGAETSALVLGGYVHGGMRGSMSITYRRPWLTKYLNMVLRQKTIETTNREPKWATLGVFKAAEIPPHRDLRNQPGMPNFVMEVGAANPDGLWLSDAHEVVEGDGTAGGDLQRELPDGSCAEGRLVDIKNKVAVFDPKKFHSYVKGEDEGRWIIAGFTPLGVENIPSRATAFLNRCGFPLQGTGAEVYDVEDVSWSEYSEDSELTSDQSSGEEEIEQQARVLRCELQEESTPDQEEDLESPYVQRLQKAFEKCAKELEDLQIKTLRKVLKVSPGEAKDVEVEELLRVLSGPLEVVHNVSLPEVKKYIHLWKEAILKEVSALVDSGTVKRLSPEQTRELKKAGLVVLPGKAVFTVKPPTDAQSSTRFRRKCRVVVCGNFLPSQGQNVYASGTSADTLRIAVALAVKMGWCLGSTDVANAFTLAPMPEELLYALTPPTIVVLAGAAQPGETWQISRVLYGLREAPRLWGDFRNGRLSEARISVGERIVVLTPTTTDENLWKVTYLGEDKVLGLVLVYVDDILMMSTRDIVKGIYAWLVADWKCSELEWVEDGSLRFLGIELRVCGDGIHLSQTGYVRDLLRQHGVSEEPGGGLTVPCSREWLQDPDSDEEIEAAEEANVKLAQKATGEALWFSTRSRPELAHAVGCMASCALKRPLKTLEISKRVMKYLARTAEYGIWYRVVEDDPMMVVYSDASYAPGGGRSYGSTMAQIAGMPVAWRASKQPIITLSVAEAELYEGCSAVQLGLGVCALLTELSWDPVMHLRIDNAAAQGLASESPGTWKTRHLRIRARFLRQEVAAQRLVISHVSGTLQKADLGTKGFDLPKFKALMDLWQIVPFCAQEAANAALRALRVTNQRGLLLFVVMCLCLVKGVQGKEDLPLDGSMEFYLVMMLAVIAAVGVWELLKNVKAKLDTWWRARQRRQQRSERLRNRTRDAIQEELRRREVEMSPRTPATRMTTTSARTTPPTASRRHISEARSSDDGWTVGRSIGVQTDPQPAMIPANRLEAYDGPFYITTHGDRVHLTSYCHGQRNATRASKRYELCDYCNRARGLYVLTEPNG